MSREQDFLARFMGDAGEAPAPDPMRAAQKNMRAPLPKRFYAAAELAEGDGGFTLTLDGRIARTPGKRPLAVPQRALADILVAEWAGQAGTIDPASMPFTRLLNAALDHVAPRMAEVAADIGRYARSDLVCYRAGEPERLVARQAALWDPILAWARETLGARFVLAEGIGFVEQPAASLAAIDAALAAERAPLTLAALHVATTLTGSALIALALRRGFLDADAAWLAAHVDEDVQMEAWGRDAEALERRAFRRREFEAAVAALAQAERVSGGTSS
jgi:chaperone required for assembly of F1-ATPase